MWGALAAAAAAACAQIEAASAPVTSCWSDDGAWSVESAVRPGAWRFGLRLARVEQAGVAVELTGTRWRADAASLAREWTGAGVALTERWAGAPLEQILDVDVLAADGAAEARFVFSVEPSWTIEILPDGSGAIARTASGAPLEWTGLRARDAAGRVLDSWMEWSSETSELAYVVAIADAVMPLEVDPLLGATPTVLDGVAPGDHFGYGAASGDFDGDGFADIAVACEACDGQAPDSGAIFVYHGSKTGIGAVRTTILSPGSASFGAALASGDSNGDGFDDLLVGAPALGSTTSSGNAYLHHGSASGLETTPAWEAVGSGQTGAQFGVSVAIVDLDADGYGDVLIGEDGWDGPAGPDQGRVYVYRTVTSDVPTLTVIDGPANGDRFGFAIASAGDVNRDGYGDFAVGAPLVDETFFDEGAFFVYHGSLAAPFFAGDGSGARFGGETGARSGAAIAGVGDVNADGYSDLVVGAPGWGPSDEGSLSVFTGSATGIPLSSIQTLSGAAGEKWGEEVQAAGDLNADGAPDLLVGVRNHTAFSIDPEGAGVLLQGTPTGYVWVQDITWGQSFSEVGQTFVSAGDVDGDGRADVFLGAWLFDVLAQVDSGRGYLMTGRSNGIDTGSVVEVESNVKDAQLGFDLDSVGDFDGDGYEDLIAGGDLYGNGQTAEGHARIHRGGPAGLSTTASWTAESNLANARFGAAVAGAGDVNGDGYGDWIVGAPGYDGGLAGQGAAYVFYGGSGAVDATSDWQTLGGQAGANYGRAVDGAGDVNGDGYADVLVGAFLWDTSGTTLDRGLVRLFYGSATGLSTTPAWSFVGDQNAAEVGGAVAGVGDLNGDGYCDFAIGAAKYDGPSADEGRVYVFLGSLSGPPAVPSFVLEVDQTGARFGQSIAGGADANGDGFSDLLVGAHLFDGTVTDGGAVFLFHGQPWSFAGPNAPPPVAVRLDGAQSGAGFGVSVTFAGDVNLDGHEDVVVGAPLNDSGPVTDGGRVSLHLGSPSGPGAATSTTTGVEAGDQAGQAVAGLDANGDGAGDYVHGAHLAESANMQSNEGSFMLHFGNEMGATGSRSLKLRQVKVADGSPVGLHGRSGSDGAARFKVFTASPAGGGCAASPGDPEAKRRTCHRVEIELRSWRHPFLSTCVTTTTGACAMSAPLPSGTDADVLVTGLPRFGFHWRARVHYPAWYPQATSRWYEFPDPNAMFENDFLALGATPTVAAVDGLAARAERGGVRVSWRIAAPVLVRETRVLRGTETIASLAGAAPDGSGAGIVDAEGARGDEYRLVVERVDGGREELGPVFAEGEEPRGCAAGGEGSAPLAAVALLTVVLFARRR